MRVVALLRLSLLAGATGIFVAGCGASSVLPAASGVSSPFGVGAQAVTAPQPTAGDGPWSITKAWSGGGDGEGIIQLELYHFETDFATRSVVIDFTDLRPLPANAFRDAMVDGQRVQPGTAKFAQLLADLSAAVNGGAFNFGVDPSIPKLAVQILAGAWSP
ncbi:MAG: hypothetical protein KGR26_11625 [Cyanobacteria bacterium REEB65]|nr:hypothetical protein [Cyanobacteria bacterium REEB65]